MQGATIRLHPLFVWILFSFVGLHFIFPFDSGERAN